MSTCAIVRYNSWYIIIVVSGYLWGIEFQSLVKVTNINGVYRKTVYNMRATFRPPGINHSDHLIYIKHIENTQGLNKSIFKALRIKV